MRVIDNISELKKGKIYYIDLPAIMLGHSKTEVVRPRLKLRGKLSDNIEEKDIIFFGDLEYLNKHYDHLVFPQCKPILLKLFKVNGSLYKILGDYDNTIEHIKQYPNEHTPCTIYEPESERIGVNFIMRNSILNEAYFDYKYI